MGLLPGNTHVWIVIISVLISLPTPILQRQGKKTLGAFKKLLKSFWHNKAQECFTERTQLLGLAALSPLYSWHPGQSNENSFPLLSPSSILAPCSTKNSEGVTSLARTYQVTVRGVGWAFSCCFWLGAPESGVEQLDGCKGQSHPQR